MMQVCGAHARFCGMMLVLFVSNEVNIACVAKCHGTATE